MELKTVENNCISSVFDLLELHGIGHSGGSLSVLQILISLYFEVGKVDPDNPKWDDRDRIVLSKAHARIRYPRPCRNINTWC
jgi:transketolase